MRDGVKVVVDVWLPEGIEQLVCPTEVTRPRSVEQLHRHGLIHCHHHASRTHIQIYDGL